MHKKMAWRLLFIMSLCLLLAACQTPLGTGPNSEPTRSRPTPTPTSASLNQNEVCPSPVPAGCLTPHALRTYYGLDSLLQRGFTGKGQTVVDIVSFGSPTLQQDMDVFDQKFGLPPITIQVISPLHEREYDPHHDKSGWAGETELDVQIIHALAPDAKIIVLTSPVAETEGTVGLPEFLQLEQYAIDHHLGTIISQSWGASEATLKDPAGQQELQKWNSFFQKATTQQGISFFASSGDNGATDYTDLNMSKLAKTPTTSFPHDSPWVTSVGGTTLLHTNGRFNEVAWQDGGGGFSAFNKEPSYQQTLPASQQSQFQGRRGVPDVSADADPETGMAFYFQGEWQTVGGTSAAAPLWAALTAIANQVAGHPLGFINPGLYKLAASASYSADFHDITVGDNSVGGEVSVRGYQATQGWDAVTGLGTPNAEKLIPDLIRALQA